MAMNKKVGSAHFSHMLCILEEFEDKGNKYFIIEYAEKDLLKEQFEQKKQVFDLGTALEIMTKIFEGLEDLHSQRFVYRNVRP